MPLDRYSTDQEYLFYRDQGRRFSPRVVLLFVYYNDVLYNGAPQNLQLPKPMLSFKTGAATVANYPVPRRPASSPAPPREDAYLLARHSVALDWAGERLEAARPALYNRLASFGLWAHTSRQEISPEFRVYMRRPPADVRWGWTMTGRILRAFAHEVWATNSRLLVIYIPQRLEVSDRHWELARLRHGLDDASWSRGAVLERLRAITTAERIPLLDLTPAMRRATRWHSWPYYEFDGHWNALGHGIAAREVAQALRAHGWLPSCAGR